MKYIAPEIEIVKSITTDIIATSSLHTEIHRFDTPGGKGEAFSNLGNVSEGNFAL